MVLRTPQTIADRSLLDDEPFKKHFDDEVNSRRAQRPRGHARPTLYKTIEDAMRSEPGGLDAARAWLRTVFKHEPSLQPEELDVFINFYWSFYREQNKRSLESLLHQASKCRGLKYRCSLDAPIILHLLEHPESSGIDLISQAQVASDVPTPTEKNARRRRARSPRRRKGKAQDAYDGEIEDNDSTTGLQHGPSLSTPAILRDSPAVSSSSSSADTVRGTVPSVTAQAKPRRDKRRKANTPPPSHHNALSDCSSLTSLDSDTREAVVEETKLLSGLVPPSSHSEEVTLVARDHEAAATLMQLSAQTPASAPTTQFAPPTPSLSALLQGSRPQRPARRAANLDRLSNLVALDTAFEVENRRMGKSQVPQPELTLPSRKAQQRVPGRVREAVTQGPIAKAHSAGLLCMSGPVKHVVAAIPMTNRNLRPSRRAVVTAKKPQFDANDGAMSEQPQKKRRANDSDFLLDSLVVDSASAPPKRKRTRPPKASIATSAPAVDVVPPEIMTVHRKPEVKRTAAIAPAAALPPAPAPALPTAPALPISEKPKKSPGRKRAFDHDPVEQSELSLSREQVSQAPQERLFIRIAPRRQAAAKAAALNAEFARADARFAKRPNDHEIPDIVLRDSGRSALLQLTCRDPEASDWDAHPNDPQPGDSSDEDVPLSVSTMVRKASSPQGATLAFPTEPLRQPEAPQEERVLEEGEIDETWGLLPMRLDEPCELTYPSLIPCPLLESSPTLNNFAPKLALPRLPPIWAQSRQEVCESFDWFRSYQGGVYFVKDIVKGYLLGGFSASRDLFHNGGQLIISHGGGKAAQSLGRAPGTVQASDQQEDDKSVRALLHNYRTGRPLVLIIDDKYSLFPYDLTTAGIAYAILGWYQIAHAWAEFQSDSTSPTGKVVRWKFAFQWCDAQGPPWWRHSVDVAESAMDDGTNTLAAVPSVPCTAAQQVCEHCKRASPQVYDAGWMCLRPKCFAFWNFKSLVAAPTALNYASSFLQPMTIETDQILEDLQPGPPVAAGEDAARVTTSRHFCKGFHCTNCGRLSCRYKWEHWECRSCSFRYAVAGRLRLASEFRNQKSEKMDRHTHHRSIFQMPLTLFKSGRSFGSRVTFVLPNGRGYIHALFATPFMNEEADATLREYQEQAVSGQLKFRRWPLRSHKCRGALLTNYFSQNTGEPYQYVGGDENTVPWEKAPTAVNHALGLITQRIQEAGLSFTPVFNEVLTAAYMEKQKMAFHSDAERGLGPNVASLSLGAAAHMHFRLHAQYAGSEMGPSESREVLTLFLKHGDVVVMEGADVQKYYEHTVVPLNFRIAATARLISHEHRAS
ncbi:hypothetical protein PsYK624_139930 [Phanerochaete sordida]|uniref:Alpha-ketoglutarate-dependent dioxygenase AlkB-like domain-containing protein n=1 Tax=Phanerochaete sordida TaxID=48140 RepID=A0A9P3GLX1_9APHY|nr:hypothetical protein PsYK624_139930 [Phanerochaete sordida]